MITRRVGGEELAPRIKEIVGDGSEVFEKAVFGGESGGGRSRRLSVVAASCMAKGEQVVRDEALAEHFLAMAEILLEVKATVLKHVEVSFSIFQCARTQAARGKYDKRVDD
jgi:hypothetical protein